MSKTVPNGCHASARRCHGTRTASSGRSLLAMTKALPTTKEIFLGGTTPQSTLVSPKTMSCSCRDDDDTHNHKKIKLWDRSIQASSHRQREHSKGNPTSSSSSASVTTTIVGTQPTGNITWNIKDRFWDDSDYDEDDDNNKGDDTWISLNPPMHTNETTPKAKNLVHTNCPKSNVSCGSADEHRNVHDDDDGDDNCNDDDDKSKHVSVPNQLPPSPPPTLCPPPHESRNQQQQLVDELGLVQPLWCPGSPDNRPNHPAVCHHRHHNNMTCKKKCYNVIHNHDTDHRFPACRHCCLYSGKPSRCGNAMTYELDCGSTFPVTKYPLTCRCGRAFPKDGIARVGNKNNDNKLVNNNHNKEDEPKQPNDMIPCSTTTTAVVVDYPDPEQEQRMRQWLREHELPSLVGNILVEHHGARTIRDVIDLVQSCPDIVVEDLPTLDALKLHRAIHHHNRLLNHHHTTG